MVIAFKPLWCKEVVVFIGKVVLNGKEWRRGKRGREGWCVGMEACTGLESMVYTRRRATLLLPTWICSCQSWGTVNFACVLILRPFFPKLVMSMDLLSFEHLSVHLFCFALPFTTSVAISNSILQIFRSWVAMSHIRSIPAIPASLSFLSHNSLETPERAPFMNVLFWGRYDFPISLSDRDTSKNL